MRAATGYALILAVVALPACYTTKVVRIDDALASKRVSVTLQDQSVVEVYGPQIYGPKLVGFVKGKYEEYLTSQVKEARVRQMAGGRTAALVVAGVLATGGVLYMVTSSGAGIDTKILDVCDEEPDNPICVQ
jgi:hypothetical protein